MSTEENKAVIREFIDGMNRGDLGPIDEYFADGYANYRTDGKVMDKAGYRRFCAAILGGDETRTAIGDLLAEGDGVAFSMTIAWTDTKGFMGKPPTGKHISMSEAYFVRFEGGRIVEMRNFQAQPRFE